MVVALPKDLDQNIEQKRATELRVKQVQSLEREIDFALRIGGITYLEGEFCLMGFCQDDLPVIDDYLAKLGWRGEYAPYQDKGWSMTTGCAYECRVDRFYVRPREK